MASIEFNRPAAVGGFLPIAVENQLLHLGGVPVQAPVSSARPREALCKTRAAQDEWLPSRDLSGYGEERLVYPRVLEKKLPQAEFRQIQIIDPGGFDRAIPRASRSLAYNYLVFCPANKSQYFAV